MIIFSFDIYYIGAVVRQVSFEKIGTYLILNRDQNQ